MPACGHNVSALRERTESTLRSAYLFARSCLPAQVGYRSLTALAYLGLGTPAQICGP